MSILVLGLVLGIIFVYCSIDLILGNKNRYLVKIKNHYISIYGKIHGTIVYITGVIVTPFLGYLGILSISIPDTVDIILFLVVAGFFFIIIEIISKFLFNNRTNTKKHKPNGWRNTILDTM